MIITTTPRIEEKTIKQYHGIVFGEVITGVNMFKDMAAGFRDIFGGRSSSYEDELQQAREEALKEMQNRASLLGANAVVGVDIDYEVIGSMLMVSATGTAVSIE